MVKLNGFENYYLCLKTMEIRGKKGVLKKHVVGHHIYYVLSLNGGKVRVSLFEIIQKNLGAIEEFFSKKSRSSRSIVTSLEGSCN